MRVVLVVDLAMGVLLLAAIVAAAARMDGTRTKRRRRWAVGWLLVGVPLPVAVAVHLAHWLPLAIDQTAFLIGIAAFAGGSAILLGSDDDEWQRGGDDDSPPWWPEFERDFGSYARRSDRALLRS